MCRTSEIFDLLLKSGIDINVIDNNGDTALNTYWRITAFDDTQAVRESKEILLIHLIKLKLTNQYINEQNNRFLEGDNIIDQAIILDIQNEIQKMKKINLKYIISLYNFLLMPKNSIVKYVYNQKLIEVLSNNNFDFENEFPNYRYRYRYIVYLQKTYKRICVHIISIKYLYI